MKTIYQEIEARREAEANSKKEDFKTPKLMKLVMLLKSNPKTIALTFICWFLFSLFTNAYFFYKTLLI